MEEEEVVCIEMDTSDFFLDKDKSLVLKIEFLDEHENKYVTFADAEIFIDHLVERRLVARSNFKEKLN